MVWDTRDLSSVWIFGPSFTTPKHRHPSADFSWTPERPMVNELVQFTDKSVAYGGATIVRWDWTFQDGNPATSSLQNPATRFTSTGPKQVTLAVTDSSGFTCSVQKIIRAQRPLEWIEIPPFIWLRNFFVSAEGFFQKVF
jgi:PKD repeat protein